MALPAAAIAASTARSAAKFIAENVAADVLAKVARDLGLKKTSAASIWQYARENPITAAAVLAEIGENAYTILDMLGYVNEEVRALNHIQRDVDEPGMFTDTSVDNAKYMDELVEIGDAARMVGGVEPLLKLKRVLAFPDSLFVMYLERKSQAKRL